MLAGEALPLVDDLAQVHPVEQHLVEGLLGEGLAALGEHPFSTKRLLLLSILCVRSLSLSPGVARQHGEVRKYGELPL